MKNFNIKYNSIAKKILIPLIAVLSVQSILFCCTVLWGGTIGRLNQNAFDILTERVINRKNYLQNEMIQRWSNLGETVEEIEEGVSFVLDKNKITIEELIKSPEMSMEVLNYVSEDIIYLLRKNSVTGAFIILDNGEVTRDFAHEKDNLKYGLYIRDLDPKYNSNDTSDLLLERAPASITKKLGIAMDSQWNATFDFNNKSSENTYHYFYKPFQAALEYPGTEYSDLGYWSTPFYLSDDDVKIITYSVPLVYNDGTVYGVLGIELTTDYLKKLLPYNEISQGKEGSYLLAIDQNEDKNFKTVISSGPVYKTIFGEKDKIYFDSEAVYGSCYKTEKSRRNHDIPYGCIQYFKLYNSNTPFEQNTWALIGIVEGKNLFQFSEDVQTSVITALFFSLIGGIVVVFFVSKWFTKPIIALVEKVKKSNPRLPVKFEKINIVEIDELAAAIEALSKDVADSSSKLSQIIEMTSASIGAFEYQYTSNQVFYTKKFFYVLGLEKEEDDKVYIDKKIFQEKMNTLEEFIDNTDSVETVETSSLLLYKLSELFGRPYWVRLKLVRDTQRILGVAEDVTSEIEEKKKIEYERDYDLLTNLLNRRAFHSILKMKFNMPKHLKTAAFIMMDLDNLKFINDTYGHDYGDQYIRLTADLLKKYTPAHAVLSRMSGDEFNILIYGYDTKDEIREIIDIVKEGIRETIFPLPDNATFRVRASAGVAWYPDDSLYYEELIRYADFAMYQIKNTIKGEFSEFDLASYEKDSYLLHNKEELNKFIDGKLVEYHFQPIVDAKTGEIFAFEALMRSKLQTLKSPLEILNLAKSQSKLYQIEKLTWFQSLYDFTKFKDINPNYHIFINSIANQELSQKDIALIESMYPDYLHRIVLELTEEEKLNHEFTKHKQEIMKKWKAGIALDDFGTGYNGEALLLTLQPQFIKIDISIVKNIDKDINRQKLLQNLTSYAAERHIKVIAEGVETEEELAKLIQYKVDYVQGYCIGVPHPVPREISPRIKESILKYQNL